MGRPGRGCRHPGSVSPSLYRSQTCHPPAQTVISSAHPRHWESTRPEHHLREAPAPPQHALDPPTTPLRASQGEEQKSRGSNSRALTPPFKSSILTPDLCSLIFFTSKFQSTLDHKVGDLIISISFLVFVFSPTLKAQLQGAVTHGQTEAAAQAPQTCWEGQPGGEDSHRTLVEECQLFPAGLKVLTIPAWDLHTDPKIQAALGNTAGRAATSSRATQSPTSKVTTPLSKWLTFRTHCLHRES